MRRIMFLYLGRRGALTRLAYEVQQAATAAPDIASTLAVSRQSEAFASYTEFGPALCPVDTFSGGWQAATGLWRIRRLTRELIGRLTTDNSEAVINLMPHIWTPFIAPSIRAAGVRFATIIHDATAHPGDRTGLANRLLLREARQADRVITLSDSVRKDLVNSGLSDPARTTTLFHPDLAYGDRGQPRRFRAGEPLRLLFFGRIYRYKGLGLLVAAMELLRQRGVAAHVGVYGEGEIGPYAHRLRALGADVENRWIADAEIPAILSRYHVMALPYIEASQSGVAALGFGAGLPAVATPVGGLTEQVVDGVTGIVAAEPSPAAYADAVARLADNPQLYDTLTAAIGERDAHSMGAFVRALVTAVLPANS